MHAMIRGARARVPGGLLALALAMTGLVHCGGDDDDSTSTTGGGGSAGSVADIKGDRCEVTVSQQPLIPGQHVEECSYLGDDSYNSNPPSSGKHYPVWAAFKTYAEPVPRGYWIHDMEHGAVVFLYNCPEGCADEVAVLQQVADQLPVDPLCTATDPQGPKRRVVITPDPKLPTRFAAASWGWTMTAPCADPEGFDAFARAHYGQGTEVLCGNGSDVIAKGVTYASCGSTAP